ncbi:MAG: hypothetical protein WBC44_04435 [Planctomycetaceae bacterium]
MTDRNDLAQTTAERPAPLDSFPAETLSETFRERKLPRDLLDVLLQIPMIFVGMVYQVVGSVLSFACLRLLGFSMEAAVLLALVIGLAFLIDVALLLSLPACRSVTLDRDGLRFRRYFGPEKRVAWSDLVRVTEVSRWEVFFRVWIWPGFPPRGSYWCGSTLRQFRIEWHAGRPDNDQPEIMDRAVTEGRRKSNSVPGARCPSPWGEGLGVRGCLARCMQLATFSSGLRRRSGPPRQAAPLTPGPSPQRRGETMSPLPIASEPPEIESSHRYYFAPKDVDGFAEAIRRVRPLAVGPGRRESSGKPDG